MPERELDFASSRGVVRHGALARDVVRRVFGVEDALVSDGSSLRDFLKPGASLEDAYQTIQAEYGVDCRHIRDGNLLAISRWLEPRLARKRPWWKFWARA